MANVAAAEAEVAAAKAGSSKASDSTAAALPPPSAKREEAEGAETSSSGATPSLPSELRDTGEHQGILITVDLLRNSSGYLSISPTS